MQIEHKCLIENGTRVIYISVYISDNYEFSDESFNTDRNKRKIARCVKKYIKANIQCIEGAVFVIAINGIILGAMRIPKNIQEPNVQIYENICENDEQEEVAEKETFVKDNIVSNVVNTNVNKTEKSQNIQKEDKVENKKEEVAEKETFVKDNIVSNVVNTNVNKTEKSQNIQKEDKVENKKEEVVVKDSNIYVKLESNGQIQTLELEEYITGVVAAEMPASFNLEALKAQAIAARTYAMKRVSTGNTLVNSTADQVYKTKSQMQVTWGADYSYYYNRVKSAVDATEGMVLKYNGEYIDAQYCAMTNGKTELPEYVWSFSRPYLQCVSSSWDESVKNFKVTKIFEYTLLSSKLGVNITKDTQIQVLSRTVSGRVDKIQIAEKVFTGVEVRSKLGLRSTDFEIELNDTNASITTKGYGHGVGMSQYGANVAASEGYTYDKILNHYYVGAQIVKI